MAELKDGCVKPARGPIVPAVETKSTSERIAIPKEIAMVARVGQEAIDFVC